MPPVGTVDVAVAIQFSGHLRDDCRLAPAALHLSACRSRFASCHAFVHTWTELEPRTPHWRRGWPSAANASSAACVRRLHSLLQPTAVAVEEQPPPPPDDSPAPDGKPFVCFECCRDDRDPEACQREAAKAQRLHWGAARHWGWRMNVRAMHRAAELRRAHEARATAAVALAPAYSPQPSALSPRSSASTSTLHAAVVLASAKASAHSSSIQVPPSPPPLPPPSSSPSSSPHPGTQRRRLRARGARAARRQVALRPGGAGGRALGLRAAAARRAATAARQLAGAGAGAARRGGAWRGGAQRGSPRPLPEACGGVAPPERLGAP